MDGGTYHQHDPSLTSTFSAFTTKHEYLIIVTGSARFVGWNNCDSHVQCSTDFNGGHGRLLAQTVATAAASSFAAANHMPSALIMIIVVVSFALILIIVLGSYELWKVQRQQSLTLKGTLMSNPDNALFDFNSLPDHNNTLSSVQDDSTMDGYRTVIP